MSDCPSRSPQPSESQRPGPAEASSSLISSSDLNRLRSSRRASRSSPTAAFPHPSRSSDLTPALPTPYNGPSSLANLLRSPSLSPVPAQLVPRSEIESRGEAASEEEDVEEGDNRSESGDSGDDDEPPTAGTIGEWTYHLEILQQPQRARACGFGDKDRRPLSPPPIIRLWVRTPSGDVVTASHVNIQFLVLMVDIWTADAQQPRNVVMHPSSQQGGRGTSPRPLVTEIPEIPSVPGPSSRPTTATSRSETGYGALPPWTGSAWRGAPSPYYLPFQISPGPSPLTRTPGQDYQMPSPLPIPSPTISGWSPHSPPRPQASRTQSYAPGFAIQQPDLLRPVTAPSLSRPRTSVLRGSPSRAFPNLPSLASITERREDPSSRPRPNRITLPAIQDPQRTSSIASSPGPSRSPQLSQTTADYSFGRFSSGSVRQPSTMSPPESSREPRLATASSDRPPSSGYFSSGRPLASAGGSPSSRRGRSPFLGSPTSPLHEQTFYAPSESSAGYPRTPELPRLQLPPTANCSRVLVGSLYSICQKLQDENGQQGLFFFAHDLGVRTEGRFTLKFTLVNLISMMQAPVAAGDRNQVLAETFSSPFTVYSAKRFPGVIPTTDLTRLFAQQNVRLPTRHKRTREESRAEVESGDGDDDD